MSDRGCRKESFMETQKESRESENNPPGGKWNKGTRGFSQESKYRKGIRDLNKNTVGRERERGRGYLITK